MGSGYTSLFLSCICKKNKGGLFMNEKFLQCKLNKFEEYLMYEIENSNLTTKKYVSEAKKFLIWLYDEKGMSLTKITKRVIVEYKQYLQRIYMNPNTINGKLGMNHIFLKFIGKGDIVVKRLNIVKRNCKPNNRFVKEIDYKKLIKCTNKKHTKAVIVTKSLHILVSEYLKLVRLHIRWLLTGR